jgi:hypothetical protein
MHFSLWATKKVDIQNQNKKENKTREKGFTIRTKTINIILTAGGTMKLLIIKLIMIISLAGIAMGMDRLLGYSFYQSIHNILFPFRVMKGAEMMIFFIFVLLWIIDLFAEILKHKKYQKQP